MRFAELSDVAKFHAVLVFNSEYDAYGVNGTGDFPPLDVDALGNLADSNGWEYDSNGDRIFE